MANFDEEPPLEAEPSAPETGIKATLNRYRLPIGVLGALAVLGVGAWTLSTSPGATVPGFYGVVQVYAFPLMCIFITALAIFWALRLRTLLMNIAAYAALGTYAIYLIVGWVYEGFIA